MPKITITGRLTRGGAYISAGRPHRNVSRSGRTWTETIQGPIGKEFILTSITHNGNHACFKAIITGQEAYKVIEEAGPDYCQFCRTPQIPAP